MKSRSRRRSRICRWARCGRIRGWGPNVWASRRRKHGESNAMIAALQPRERLQSHVMSVVRFERFFRIVARLDVDKQDLKRYSHFVNRKIFDLLIRGEETAKAN